MSHRELLCRVAGRGMGVRLTALAVLAACANAGPQPGPPPRDAASAVDGKRAGTELVITSMNPGPVAVYAVSGSLRIRMGTVTAFREARMVFPSELVGRGAVVHLLARPIGDRAQVMTEAFQVERGDRVQWTLLRPLESSSVTLRVF